MQGLLTLQYKNDNKEDKSLYEFFFGSVLQDLFFAVLIISHHVNCIYESIEYFSDLES